MKTGILARIVFAFSTASIVTGLVAATSDVVADRQAAMKNMAGSMGDANKLGSGGVPWDAAAAQAFGTGIATNAAALHAFFPDGSGTLPGTRANAALWQNKPDLDRRLTELEQLGTTAAQAKTADEFKTAFQAVNLGCRGCHALYRG